MNNQDIADALGVYAPNGRVFTMSIPVNTSRDIVNNLFSMYEILRSEFTKNGIIITYRNKN
ncbi:Uncharacterised protein [Candidatus Tiddalikarchaeum anstoanum]|nr:Uncharacterised protein [Candidatus Tiddalikarchaeum anstoanum]